MMQKIVFATGNAGKMKEIRMILSDLMVQGEPVDVLSMKEAGVETDIAENGNSFLENAMIKAKAVAACTKEAIVLADEPTGGIKLVVQQSQKNNVDIFLMVNTDFLED